MKESRNAMAIAALIFKSDSFYIARIWNFRQKEKGWVQQHWPWNKKEIFFLGKKEKTWAKRAEPRQKISN